MTHNDMGYRDLRQLQPQRSLPFDGVAASIAGLATLAALISYNALKPQSVSCGGGDYAEAAFNHAVDQVANAAHELLHSLVTTAEPRDRETEAAKARAKSAERFGTAAR